MKKQRVLLYSYMIMLLIIFILPFFSAEGYSIIKNTSSQLGAQLTPNAWIMNGLFILLGLSSLYEGLAYFKKNIVQSILIIVFGVSLILCAFFRHAPINPELTYVVKEYWWHSIFSNITGFSFTFFAIAISFIEPTKGRKLLALIVAIIATVLSMLMFTYVEMAGIFQRGMFILSFGWLIYVFEKKRSQS